jgi:hypothetical protein
VIGAGLATCLLSVVGTALDQSPNTMPWASGNDVP